MRTHFHRKSSVFPVIKNSNFQIFPKSSPRPFYGVRKCGKKLEKHRISFEIRCFYGCGGRTRTYDLRVMSPTSFQLLYSAILGCTPNVLGYCITAGWVCQDVFPAMFWPVVSVSREIVKLTTPGETRIIDIITRRAAFYAYIIQSRCCAGSVAAFPP